MNNCSKCIVVCTFDKYNCHCERKRDNPLKRNEPQFCQMLGTAMPFEQCAKWPFGNSHMQIGIALAMSILACGSSCSEFGGVLGAVHPP